MQSEPDRRAAQPQRVKQQVQIQIAIHKRNVASVSGRVKWFLTRANNCGGGFLKEFAF
jgi:hypothetical protein